MNTLKTLEVLALFSGKIEECAEALSSFDRDYEELVDMLTYVSGGYLEVQDPEGPYDRVKLHPSVPPMGPVEVEIHTDHGQGFLKRETVSIASAFNLIESGEITENVGLQ